MNNLARNIDLTDIMRDEERNWGKKKEIEL